MRAVSSPVLRGRRRNTEEGGADDEADGTLETATEGNSLVVGVAEDGTGREVL